MAQIAKIAIEAATYAIDKPYSYQVPDGMNVSAGLRVMVPFGRGNRRSEGMVLAVESGQPERRLKAVLSVLDEAPQVCDRQIRLALWMCQRYFCTFYDALHAILPIGLWYEHREIWSLTKKAAEGELTEKEAQLADMLRQREQTFAALQAAQPQARAVLQRLQDLGLAACRQESNRRTSDKTDKLISLAIEPEEADVLAQKKRKQAPRQSDALLFLLQNGETSLHDLVYFTGVSRQAVMKMVEGKTLSMREQEVFRVRLRAADETAPEIRLNAEQQAAYEDILQSVHSGKAGVTLLQGVTGSGKTEVYIRLAQRLLQEGRTAMILVPEIALTPQMMQRFSMYFGEDVALLHSGLGVAERYDQYKRIRQGAAKIVLGTRSAVFAPLENLGLIVIDEEQEGSYESEKAPCYHARDIAKYRCAKEGAWLVLGSATPTVETAYHARQGSYRLALLRKRYNENALPRVSLVDMRQELRQGNYTSVSRPLYEEIRKNLELGQQTILFLNRRGNSRQLICPSCGYVPQCLRCSAYLTYHSVNRRMMCHLCGYSEAFTPDCPACGAPFKPIGAGTQKVEQELKELFPDTPILRMDADSVGTQHERVLQQFEEEKIPILLGTQMVAKGLDFDNVTLVGVLAADQSLYVDHYRAAERTFVLLTQVVGRAGRGSKEGRAIIQTYTPENEVLTDAAAQDYEHFYEREIGLRRMRREPPFADEMVLTVTGTEESEVQLACRQVADSLREAVLQPPYGELQLQVLGPAPASVVKVNNRFRYRITVVGRCSAEVRRLLSAYMKEFSNKKEYRKLHIFAECNRMN